MFFIIGKSFAKFAMEHVLFIYWEDSSQLIIQHIKINARKRDLVTVDGSKATGGFPKSAYPHYGWSLMDIPIKVNDFVNWECSSQLIQHI